MGGASRAHEGDKKILVGKAEEKGKFRRPRRRMLGYVKVYLTEIG
jgi:hypothetical protein